MHAAHQSTAGQLADELQAVSYYGIGHAMGDLGADAVPNLARIALQLAPDAKGRLRVSIAQAVRQAVLLIDPRSHAEAAAALLWLDLEDQNFEEDRSRKRKPLHERHPVVAALLGYKLSSYERRKHWRPLYEQVARNLLTLVKQQVAIETVGTALIPLKDRRTPDITAAEAAADLYFAALSSLFVADFHNRCAENGQLSIRRLFDWVGAADWLLCCYCQFLSAHRGRGQFIPQTDDERFLVRLIEVVEAHDPFYGISEYITVYAYAYELKRGRKDKNTMTWLAEAHADLHQKADKLLETTRDAIGREFILSSLEEIDSMNGGGGAHPFEHCWVTWYQQQFDIGDWPPTTEQVLPDSSTAPEGIATFAAIGDCYLDVLTTHIDPGRPLLAQARQRAHRIISSFYDIDDWRPLVLGRSLRDHVDHFFDTTGRRTCSDQRNMLKI